jgi:23S rRNA (cytidine1920-2'-O)/16S rRNA (cytidine1409-2'-O)-methyltransferase
VPRTGAAPRQALAVLVRRQWPQLDEPGAAEAAITAGEVLVDGSPITNPRSQVAASASLRMAAPPVLAGRRKLDWALDHFGLVVTDAVAVDVGSSTGGFVSALLGAGAARVYAVDAGHGQLLGSLRQDPRVVNLERTNVGHLNPEIVPEPIGVVTIDVSYLALSAAVAQVGAVELRPAAVLVGLVKPMFELRLATIPGDRPTLDRALAEAVTGIAAAGWSVQHAAECPVRGARGAVEFFVHAIRPADRVTNDRPAAS